MSRLYLSNPCGLLITHCTRRCGRSRRPAFPAPSVREGATKMQSSGEIRAVRTRAYVSHAVASHTHCPHPEERRSRVSKDGHGLDRGLMIRDALRAPHHEGQLLTALSSYS